MPNEVMLPNSILKSAKVDHSMSKNGMEWFYIFCASCGADGGRVLKNDIPNKEEFAFYLCNDCAAKYGQIDGCYMVPDEVFFEKVKQASIEHHGKTLTVQEMLVELDKPESFLLKLLNERKSFVASE